MESFLDTERMPANRYTIMPSPHIQTERSVSSEINKNSQTTNKETESNR